nr:conserved hypothetical protein [Ipomoea trifida]
MGWLLLAFPPKNRTCEFPRIRLKWRRPFPSRLREGFQNKQKNNIPLSIQQLEVYLNKMSGFHSKSSPLSMQNSFANILLPKWNCTSRIGLKRHDPRLILDMYPLFQVHHKEIENKDLLYPKSAVPNGIGTKATLPPTATKSPPPPPQVKLVLLVAPGAVAPGVGKSLENGVALNTSRSLKRIEMLTFLAPLALPSNTFSESVIFPILKENELHTWNERYMKRLIESGKRVGLLSRSIQPKSNSSPQSCFAWKGEKTWNETLKG